MSQPPSIGRVVHYYDRDGEGPYAATVVNVEESTVTLWVLPRHVGGETMAVGLVPEGGFGTPRSWCWPPYVPPAKKPGVMTIPEAGE